MKPNLIIIETSDIGATYTAQAAERLGYHPIFLCNKASYSGDTLVQLDRLNVIQCETSDENHLLQVLRHHNINKIAGVITFLDSRLIVCISLAQLLKVPSIDPSVLKLKDKSQVINLIPQFSPESLSFRINAIPLEDLSKMAKKYKKLMIKPSLASGGLGGFAVEANDVFDIPSRIKAQALPKTAENGSWIAQAFTEGNLYSIEGFCKDGKAHFLGFTDRTKIGSTESSLNFPADKALSEPQKNRAYAAAETLIKRSNFQYGYFHIEVLVGETVAVIDANMGRLGGGALGQVIALAYGVGPVDIFEHVIQNTLRFDHNIPQYYFKNPRQCSGIHYGASISGTLQKLMFLPSSNQILHTLLLGENQKVPAMGQDNWSWIGILAGPKGKIEKEVQKIRFQIDGQITGAVF